VSAERQAVTNKRVRGDFDVTRSLSGWRRVAYQFARLLVKGTCSTLFRAEVHHRERVPTSGAYVLAPTHRSGWDIPLASLVTRRRVRFMGKASIWRVPVVGELLALLGGFPVERGTADQQALRRVLQILEAGEPVVIYPEGTRQVGDDIGELFDGAAWVAARTQLPIVPMGIAGSQRILRSGRRGVHLPKVVVVVGEPIVLQSTGGRVPRSEVRRVTAELRPVLQALYDEAEARRTASRR
jgi:1-acyl-sn-glycerol-3-phosphate acyltransferase